VALAVALGIAVVAAVALGIAVVAAAALVEAAGLAVVMAEALPDPSPPQAVSAKLAVNKAPRDRK
jgi:hypothetical protein